jgi:hypothetical protein
LLVGRLRRHPVRRASRGVPAGRVAGTQSPQVAA